MSIDELRAIADGADMIVSGYAFTRCDDGVRVLNLCSPERSALLGASGDMLETTMDDLELALVQESLLKNAEFIEPEYA